MKTHAQGVVAGFTQGERNLKSIEELVDGLEGAGAQQLKRPQHPIRYGNLIRI